MCGRFVQKSSAAEMAALFRVAGPLPNVRERYNAAPTQEIAVVRREPESDENRLDLLVWGLVPSWAKDTKIAYSTINARAETVATAPAFRTAYQKRRCIVPADAFYEWTGPKGDKQPHAIAMKDRTLFGFAGLWEGWKAPESDNWLKTFTIITTTANETIAPLHPRMPVILAPEDYDRWLAPGSPPAELLQSYPAEAMETWMVGRAVNGPALDHPELLNSL